jgi:hypothetical protein
MIDYLHDLPETKRATRLRRFGHRIALYFPLTELYSLLSGIAVGIMERERSLEHGFCEVSRTHLSHVGMRVADCAQQVGSAAQSLERQMQ